MLSILADRDVEGQFADLVLLLESDAWKEFWHHVNVTAHTFESLGIAGNTPDVDVWRLCQARNIILVTNNRNSEGDDSLGATLQRELRPDSLPVITFANVQRFESDKQYAHRVVESLLDYLLRIDEVRGTGRLYVP